MILLSRFAFLFLQNPVPDLCLSDPSPDQKLQKTSYTSLNLHSFRALRRAACLIAISENTRQDLIRFVECKPENVVGVYYGIEEMFQVYTTAEKTCVRVKWNCPDNGVKRVLISGSQFYKNLPAILQSFARLRALCGESVELIKVGRPDPVWNRAVRRWGLERSARNVGEVSHSAMPELLNCVDVLLFPSLYEGFGRPPLEAMACGVPVVASNVASLPEVVGGAGLMCAPQEYEGLAQAMYTVLTNDDLRQSLIENGLKRARQFTWESTAQRTLEVYERVANGSHS